MSEFEVEIKQVETYVVEVVANNEKEAKKLALGMLEKDKDNYHQDSDAKIKVVGICGWVCKKLG